MKKIIILALTIFTINVAKANLNMLADEHKCEMKCDEIGSGNQQHSQEERQKEHERIQALKVGFITEKVALTPSESEKFWPLYNQYWSEKRELARKKRDLFIKGQRGEYENTDLVAFVRLDEDELALTKKWIEKFKTILEDKKIVKFFFAEEDFKRFLMTQRK